MLSFHAFGGPAVANSDGTELGNAASQRRVLALLALAAGAGPKGVTRDRAMGLLWPEADSDRARHALSQTLYHMRNGLRQPDLFLPGNDIRLNPSVISADTWEFDRLLKAGDDQGAIDHYKGPFLDGFYIAAAAEFEEWSASLRQHYAALAGAALERLGAAAEARGDWSVAVEWRQRLAAQDLASSRATVKLMDALVKAGDTAAALRFADVHRRAVRALLDAEPDASVTSLENAIRASVAARGPVPVVSEPAHAADVALVPVPPVPASPVAPPTIASRVLSWRPRALRRRHVVAGAGAVLAAALLWFGKAVSASNADRPARIVIAPFRVSGADASLAYLQEGMIDLLSSRLLDDSLTQAIDAGQTMAAWNRLGTKATEADNAAALQLAQRVGATGVIVGSVVGTPGRLYVSASLLSSPKGNREIEVHAEGPADSLSIVIDRLAGNLLAARSGEADRLASRTTTSLPALRAYLAGQAAYRRGDYRAAGQQYEAALRADSQFALAAFHLALSVDRRNNGAQNNRALEIAWNNQWELSPRDRAHLIAFAGPNYPQPSTSAEALAAWDAALNVTPIRADIWYEFGEKLLRQGGALAVDDATRRAARAFARSLELDPADREGARPMLIIAAARVRDTALIRRYASPAALRDSMGAMSPFIQWTVARVFGDRATLARVRANFPQLDDENLRLIAMSSLYDNVFRSDGERAVKLLSRRATGARGFDALLAQHAFAMAEGDPFHALDVTEQIEERMPGMHAHLRLRVLDALYGNGNRAAAESAAGQLERVTYSPRHVTELEGAVFLADLCVLEQWHLARGVRTKTQNVIATLRVADAPRIPVAISANPQACGMMLDTWLAVDAGAPDARNKLRALDELLLDGPAASDAATYSHILLARLHRQIGDGEGALWAIRRRGYLTGWPRYLTTAESGEASLSGTAATLPRDEW